MKAYAKIVDLPKFKNHGFILVNFLNNN